MFTDGKPSLNVFRRRLRELPTPLGMPVPGGGEHREAPVRLPGCSKNPMGAAGLSKIRRFPGWPKTLGCRFDASWFATMLRTQAREGTSGGESLCDGPGIMSSGGAARSWNHGRGTRAVGLKCLGGCGASDVVFLRVDVVGAPRTNGRSGHGNVSRPHRAKGPSRRETP